MRTAVDTSVLLDVLMGDPRFGLASREALRTAYDHGALVACEVVWAEVRAHFPATEPFQDTLASLGVGFEALSADAASLAGELWRESRTRRSGRGRDRVIADFLIGAHAQEQADAFLTRDEGFYRTYFARLKVVGPLRPGDTTVTELKGLLQRPRRRPASLAEMDAAIARQGRRRRR